jgi:hypothetical protein
MIAVTLPSDSPIGWQFWSILLANEEGVVMRVPGT